MNAQHAMAALATLLSISTSTHASPFSYNFVEVQILKPDSEVLDNGFGVDASIDVVPNYNISASYRRNQGQNTQFDRDSDRYSLGVGYHNTLNRATDFTSLLYYLHDETTTDVKANDFTINRKNSGGGVQIGLRRVLGNDIDGTLNVGVRHLDGVDDAYTDLGVEYHMSEVLSVGATYTFDNQINAGAAKVRYAF